MNINDLLHEVKNGNLAAGTLSSPKSKEAEAAVKITIRPISIKGKLCYQISDHFKQKALHRNISMEECVVFVDEALKHYKQGVFTTKTTEYHVLSGKDGKLSVMKRNLTTPPKAAALSHNVSKNYILPEGQPVPFLVQLGIMTAEGKVVAKKYDKFRQINRFLEMVRDIIAHLPRDKVVRIVDFGCGKAYLTFALHYYLHQIEKFNVHIIGLDLKEDVVTHCNALASELGIKQLEFIVADIKDYEVGGTIDLMISLHACDTATDAALEKAVRWKAKVILCVPCCQHELYSQVRCDALTPLLQHGILRERFAALATDAVRAELLMMHGYEVQVLEFIDMEHTPKNLLIRAVKSAKNKDSKSYLKLKEFLHINPALERFLT